MAETKAAPKTAAEANGRAQTAAPCEDCASKAVEARAERWLGLIAAAVGVAIVVFGVDLATGGLLSRLAGVPWAEGERGNTSAA